MTPTPPDAFVHLHVASGYSLRHGVDTPTAIVARAAELDQPAVALTDRDGLYGAIRFARAADAAGIAAIHGVDLAVDTTSTHGGRGAHATPRTGATGTRGTTGTTTTPGPTSTPDTHPPRRTPARGGPTTDHRLPRITVLARGTDPLPPATGWAHLVRLVTATHLTGTRGTPITTPHLLTTHATHTPTGHHTLTILLGPDSDVGRALLARRPDHAAHLLDTWTTLLPPGALAVEVVCHHGPPGSRASLAHARALHRLAAAQGVPSVLTNAVRHVHPGGAPTADVLDAARRGVPLDTRHLDRVTTAGHLADTAHMHDVARAVAGDDAPALLARTAALAADCVQHPGRDLGIGSVQLPEPDILGLAPGEDPQQVLAARCRSAVTDRYPDATGERLAAIERRLDDELATIATLGYATYFLTVALVCDLIRDMGGRVAARGSGAGSLVNHLLRISGVDPVRHDLLMERFCTPLRAQLPDIDIDVESHRRTAIYERILDHFGGDRVTCVSMMDTYRVRHAMRDVGAALGMLPVEIDAIATAFPHIRARDARSALADLPELRRSGLDAARLTTFFDLVERLDGLPRHVALHPCGVVLSNRSLLDRTPVEASYAGFPMSQHDKDDVEALGLLKLDVLGIRMQSAMAHAVAEVARVDGARVDLDDPADVPLDDPAAYALIRSTHTLGCFQIESPGQRELVGKLAPATFDDIIIDISLFRPGPVKSDMITPFLRARHGWAPAEHLHPTLVPALEETCGVVVFHEQVLRIVATTTGCTLAQADEVRRAMGTRDGRDRVEAWWRPAARARGYAPDDVDRIWEVLAAFASFGFCKAHAAAFALPTYQSAWLKAHHPAAFLAGVLTHDPGMYPKRLILDDARSLGITVLPLDVNASDGTYRVERLTGWGAPPAPGAAMPTGGTTGPDSGGVAGERTAHPDLPDARGYGIRLSLADVAGMSDAELTRIVAGRPYATLADLWNRATPSRPVTERLVLAGALDSLYGIDVTATAGRRGRTTRRDLLLHVAELDRHTRATARAATRAGRGPRRPARPPAVPVQAAQAAPAPVTVEQGAGPASDTAYGSALSGGDVRAAAAAQGRPAAPAPEPAVQLTLDLHDAPELTPGSGLPELTAPERVRAELDILGLDASQHVVHAYEPLLDALGVTRARDLLTRRSRAQILVAGVKVATQTPPVRSGRRVVFLTLDDSTGPVDATFFEDAQAPYAQTIFHSWLLLVRGVVRRTGPRGVSLRATAAFDLTDLWERWRDGGLDAVTHHLDHHLDEYAAGVPVPGARRVLRHPSGFTQSPYADTHPAGHATRDARRLGPHLAQHPDHPTTTAPRTLWHASPGSAGH